MPLTRRNTIHKLYTYNFWLPETEYLFNIFFIEFFPRFCRKLSSRGNTRGANTMRVYLYRKLSLCWCVWYEHVISYTFYVYLLTYYNVLRYSADRSPLAALIVFQSAIRRDAHKFYHRVRRLRVSLWTRRVYNILLLLFIITINTIITIIIVIICFSVVSNRRVDRPSFVRQTAHVLRSSPLNDDILLFITISLLLLLLLLTRRASDTIATHDADTSCAPSAVGDTHSFDSFILLPSFFFFVIVYFLLLFLLFVVFVR